jgi:DNA-binding transcriptional ArsR family regulator
MPEPTFILTPEMVSIQVDLAPVYNMLYSLMLLNKADHLSGLGEWVSRTKTQLTPEENFNNKLVLYGLFYAVEPDRSWPTFEAYLAHLATLDPNELRDRTFRAYAPLILSEDGTKTLDNSEVILDDLDLQGLLGSVDAFLEFLGDRFPQKAIDIELESEAHRYLNDPPALQDLVVTHLRHMWETYLASEWEQSRSILQASVEAFRQVDFQSMDRAEAMVMVTGQDFETCFQHDLDDYEQIVFIPSAHVGPYTGKFITEDTLWLIFGARNPAGIDQKLPDLSRAEILVRVNALADDNRLRILRLIHEAGELRSQEIMTKLDLSQSAASRHLKQLSATGFLVERRCTGAKCYELNPKRIEDTLMAISSFLLGSH